MKPLSSGGANEFREQGEFCALGLKGISGPSWCVLIKSFTGEIRRHSIAYCSSVHVTDPLPEMRGIGKGSESKLHVVLEYVNICRETS